MAGRTLGVADAEPTFDAVTVTGTTTLKGNTAIGDGVADVVSFYGVTGTAQLSAAAQATSAASWVTVCGTRAGFGTSDEAVTFFNTFRNIQHVLKTTGLWKGSA